MTRYWAGVVVTSSVRPLKVAVLPEKETADPTCVSVASHSLGTLPLSSQSFAPEAATLAVFVPVTTSSVTVSVLIFVKRVKAEIALSTSGNCTDLLEGATPSPTVR